MAARHRSFMAVFYPESSPEDYREVIDGWHVPALLVLHDRDEEPDGTPKKAHYHLLLVFSGKKSLGQVHELIDQLGTKVVEPVYDTHASARYLVHADHPEKFQYGVGAIDAFSGACVSDLTASLTDPLPEILDFVRSEGLVTYAHLVNYCRDHEQEWLKSVAGRTQFWVGYLKSVEWDRVYYREHLRHPDEEVRPGD